MKGLKTFLALLLCLSVLLSGCITMGTEMFKPEPRSVGDWVIRVWGGLVDFSIPIAVSDAFSDPDYSESIYVSGGTGDEDIYVFVLGGILLIIADIALHSTLPYRKAYHEKRESEEEATEANDYGLK